MRVSVAMCTYNGGDYIRRQMDSIFAQTRLPDEIIICDDISKDDTVSILKEYEGRGIDLQIIQNPENLGFARNFRKCISLCTGDIIFLCDQDDIWEPEKTRQLCDLMEGNPEILSVVTNFYLIDSQGNRLSAGEKGDNPFFNKQKHRVDWKRDLLYKVNATTVFVCNVGPGCTQAIRRSIIADFMKCPLADPHDFLLNRVAAIEDGLFYYDKPLTQYRVHDNQTIGVPEYVVYRLKKNYAAMIEEYVNLPRELFYHLFIPNSEKVHLPPPFNDEERIAYYDTVPMAPHIRKKYEKWKKMTKNRAALYLLQKPRLKLFLRQIPYNKYFVFGYAPVERLRIQFWDLAMLLVKERK